MKKVKSSSSRCQSPPPPLQRDDEATAVVVASSPVELMNQAKQALSNFRIQMEKHQEQQGLLPNVLLMPPLEQDDLKSSTLLKDLEWMEGFLQRRRKLLAIQKKRRMNNNSTRPTNEEGIAIIASNEEDEM